MGKAIGIDLGTTNSVMARMHGERPRTIENMDGSRLTPSVVSIGEDSERLVGELAKAQAVMYPQNTVFSVKRFIGRNFRDPDVQRDIERVPYRVTEAANGEVEIWLNGKAYSPIEISAFILEALKQEAREQMGEVSHAVITVPAYFGQRQKEATRMAGQLAGLKVMLVLPEPTAAALAYGINAQTDQDKTLLVYDLGGGTFDVTVLLVSGGNFIDLAKTGDNHLGGDDFDQEIINYIIDDTRRKYQVNLQDNREALQKLKEAAEKAKIRLYKMQKTHIAIPNIVNDGRGHQVNVKLTLTRAEYEAMIQPYVDRTIDLVHEAIQEADYRPEEIDQILLVGGSTLNPLIAKTLRREFGADKISRGINAMECVAVGAAIQAGILPPGTTEEAEDWPEEECPGCGQLDYVGRSECIHCGHQRVRHFTTQQSTAIPLGIQTVGDKMEEIIPKGTFYPTQEPITRYLFTDGPNQTILRIPVYEGFEDTASMNEYLGEAQGELPPNLPNATEVAVSFSLDASGIIYVTAQLPDQPDIKIQAEIEWKPGHKAPQQQPTGGTDTRPRDWREEAKGAMAMAAFTIERGRRYLNSSTLYRLQQLGQTLLDAINNDDELQAKRTQEELLRALDGVGHITLIVFGEALAQMPETDPAERHQLMSLVQAAEQALARGDQYQLGPILRDLSDLVGQIMGRLNAAGQTVTGFEEGLPGLGLLRGSGIN